MPEQIPQNQPDSPKILVIVGPTATGKSDLAVHLARTLHPTYKGEVVSADSRQIYQGLDIGTGKITVKEMRGIPHYMIDVVSPFRSTTSARSGQKYTVAHYQKDATRVLEKILSKQRSDMTNPLPIVCGGTGFYIQALIDGTVLPEVPPNLALRKKLASKSADELFSILKERDPARAATIDPRNSHRLIRALEIVEAIGKVPQIQKSVVATSAYNTLFIGVTRSPDMLRKRIDTRLTSRLKAGMLAEAKRLHARGLSWKRMEELGLEYRYMAIHLRGTISHEEMVQKLRTEIWRYAKRQMTWFRRDKRIHWFDLGEKSAIKKIEKEVVVFLKKNTTKIS